MRIQNHFQEVVCGGFGTVREGRSGTVHY